VDVVSHNTKVPINGNELPLRLPDEGKEQPLESQLRKSRIVMVYFRRDMICRSVMECSQTSHTYEIVMELLWCQALQMLKMF
jgi:hypothetical protein